MNLQDVPKELDKLKNKLAVIFKDGEVVAAKQTEGAITQRIFVNGKNAYNERIGGYVSRAYMRRRRKAGRQVGYVDLQMTGTLFDSIITGEQDDKTVVGITRTRYEAGETTGQVAKYNEKRYGQIFSVSETERNEAKQYMMAYISMKLQELL